MLLLLTATFYLGVKWSINLTTPYMPPDLSYVRDHLQSSRDPKYKVPKNVKKLQGCIDKRDKEYGQ